MSPEQASPLLLAIAAMLTALAGVAGGVWRVWSKISARIDMLEAELDEYKEEGAAKDRKLHTMGVALQLLIPVVARLDPKNAVLEQVGSILGDSFPVDPTTPPELIDLLAQLNAPPPRRRPRKPATP